MQLGRLCSCFRAKVEDEIELCSESLQPPAAEAPSSAHTAGAVAIKQDASPADLPKGVTSCGDRTSACSLLTVDEKTQADSGRLACSRWAEQVAIQATLRLPDTTNPDIGNVTQTELHAPVIAPANLAKPNEPASKPTSGTAPALPYLTIGSSRVSREDEEDVAKRLRSKHQPSEGADPAPETAIAARGLSQLMGPEPDQQVNVFSSVSCSASPESDPVFFTLHRLSQSLQTAPSQPLPQRPALWLSTQQRLQRCLTTHLPLSSAVPGDRRGPSEAGFVPQAARGGTGGGAADTAAAVSAVQTGTATAGAAADTAGPRGRQPRTVVRCAAGGGSWVSSGGGGAATATVGTIPAAVAIPSSTSVSEIGTSTRDRDVPVSNVVRAMHITRNMSRRAAVPRQRLSLAPAASTSAVGSNASPLDAVAAATADLSSAAVEFAAAAAGAAVLAARGGSGQQGAPTAGETAGLSPFKSMAAPAGSAAGAAAGGGGVHRSALRASAPQVKGLGHVAEQQQIVREEVAEEYEEAGADTTRQVVPLMPNSAAPGVPLVPTYGSAQMTFMYGQQVKLPYQASRHLSQVAFLNMLQLGAVGGVPAGGAQPESYMSYLRPPYQHVMALDLSALSKEITGLSWIGQGGGGAVFQGVWQGAPVAVKFLLSEANGDVPGAVDAVTLEGVVSSVVNHPNVVHTFAFQHTRLTDASFNWDNDFDRIASNLEDQGNPDLFESLLDTGRMHGSMATYGSGGMRNIARRTAATAEPDVNRHRTKEARDAGGGGSGGRPGDEDEGGGGAQQRCTPTIQIREKARGVAAVASAAAPAAPVGPQTPVRQAALESTFQSDEGFGDPDISGSTRGWTVLQALTHLKARPGMFMTYIIMEYCDRGSLLSAIRRGIFRMGDDATYGSNIPSGDAPGVIPGAMGQGTAAAAAAVAAARFPRRIVLRALLRTARDVAQGMSHLHANGIIHGDLKPGNVLLRGCRTDRRGFVAMIADFGLSKVTQGDKPLEAHHWSTVTAMAPEVIMGRWLKASDVFSYGILLWQLVTSEPVPYGKLTVSQVLLGVSQGTLKPEWPASAHPALVRLGRACLAHSPEKRPSFEAIVQVLTKIEKHVRDELRLQKDGGKPARER